MEKYDFSGWATRNNLRCSDGRTIMKDAFKHNDGKTVPLVWNHQHNEPYNVLGHALLENRDEGVYAYCTFNETENGQIAKVLVQHGDISALSIYANQLQQQGGNVLHGAIREVSLVHAGANPGASIDSVIRHSDGSEVVFAEDEGILYTGENISLYHADSEEEDTDDDDGEETIADVFNTLNEKQKNVVYAMIGQAMADKEEEEDSEGGSETVKHNIFDNDEPKQKEGFLSHSDEMNIIQMAKTSGVGSLQNAISAYVSDNDTLQHGFEDIEQLFPDYKDVYSKVPEPLERDLTWVDHVMRKTHKSPYSRIRTRQMDARGDDLRAHGYQKKGDFKTESGNIKLMQRTTDPQTVYRKDSMHRDDITDITDFNPVDYLYRIMRHNLDEDLALATLVGDLRDDGDPDKIHENHIRPIWKDDELYTNHYDVDIKKAKEELQGTDTNKHFSENYIYAEAIIMAALYSREQYKGSGSLEFYCTPHLLNVMLLARDFNGRRIYDSKSDLEKALNVTAIHTAEQFEGLTRTTDDGKKKELLGIFVNLSDYQHGSTKGGEITSFKQFDIDFNLEKYLIETRLSGALTRIKSAIALEIPVDEAAAG